MKKIGYIATFITLLFSSNSYSKDIFPDGTPVDNWFKMNEVAKLSELGKQYIITDYGVKNDSTIVQTKEIQSIIDMVSANGGGVVVIPKGTFLSGSLFFKNHTNLFIDEGATLKGSDDISNFPILKTRIEGQTIDYFAALVNADGLDGFTMTGKGTVNGNGLRYWKSFWLRRKVNRQCTNIEELRPRLVYISNCKNVQISGLYLKDSPFWTTHLYKCDKVKMLNLHITSPLGPVKAPSTDAIDIDACSNVHVKGCFMAVNDDAIALKGGKGPWADKDENNGPNNNIIIEDCEYGLCHGCLTCGSESIHSNNIIFRRIKVGHAFRLLWLKMRPDTPQRYENILVEDVTGSVDNFLFIKPWKQFFDLKGRTDMPLSYGENVTMKNIDMKCKIFFNVEGSDQYKLRNFTLENIKLQAENIDCDKSIIENFKFKKVNVFKAAE